MFSKSAGNITIYALLFASLILAACNGCNQTTGDHPRKPIETAPYPVKLERFEKELFSVDTNNLEPQLASLYKKYGIFYTSYASDIMKMPPTDSLFSASMKMLLSIKRLHELQQIVDSNFNNMSDVEADLSRAMGIYKKEFPAATVPRFVTFISEFGNGNIIYDSMLCIGLDFYMNKRFENFYRGLEFPEFRIAKMQRNYIAPNTVKSLAIGLYDNQTSADKRFIAQMILEGKYCYFTKSLLPGIHDSVIIGYSKSQLEWCKKNEVEIWTHFIEKNMLYESNPGKFMRYLNDGPFTVADGVPKESSPAIGTWTGWQIVNHYMKENPEVSLQELMRETDFEKILKQSKYRPQ